VQNLDSKMTGLVLGVVIIIIALIFGGVQLLHVYNIYGSGSNKWYYYGSIGVIGLVGIMVTVWSLLKKQTTT
jgi:hypothetical protein